MHPSRVIPSLVVAVTVFIFTMEWNGVFQIDKEMVPTIKRATGEGLYPRTCPSWRHPVQKCNYTFIGATIDHQELAVEFDKTTSPQYTIVTIVDRKVAYRPLDVLTVKIESRDWNDRPKAYGGDFFRLKIFSKDPYSAAGEDEIIDFNNGTYLVYFTLRWSGKVMVQVKLIHPVEILPQMKLTLSGKVGLNVTFVGEFISRDISEEVICRYVELEHPYCNLSNPRTHGPWYCQKPKDPSLTCEDWRFHKMYKGTFLKLEEQLSPLSKSLLQQSHMIEIKLNCSIIVGEAPKTNVSAIVKPYCSMVGVPIGIHTSGHFFRNKWYPNDCRVVEFSLDTGMRCLTHTNIVFLGDSTIRQLFEYFRDTIYKKHLTSLPLPKGAIKTHGPLELKSNKFNTSIKYHFHGLPSSGTRLVLRTDNIEFIADRINSGKDGCEVVYVLSLWAHFIATGKEFYRQRLLAIKSAVQSFLDRCPRSKVIIKGANTKDHPAVWIAIVSSEWNIVQHEHELRKVFENEKRVGFIDAFDVTRVQPYEDKVHPDRNIVKEFVNQMLTLICKVNIKS